jgi:hypothetical protein
MKAGRRGRGRKTAAASVWFAVVFLLFAALPPLAAQDFGFGFGDDGANAAAGGNSGGGSALAVSVGGEVSASAVGYGDDFTGGADAVRLGNLFSGKLNFTAETARAKGVINLKIDAAKPPQAFLDVFDEVYVSAYFGKFNIEGGLRKLTWGKADSLGPLDVINPLDYSDMTDLSDMMKLKIARPLVHASLRLGQFSKLEGVFVPHFEPLRFATEGRWTPAQMKQDAMTNMIKGYLGNFVPNADSVTFTSAVKQTYPDTQTLEYAQAGARFTTTVGPADFGVQYYYGRLTRPALTGLNLDLAALTAGMQSGTIDLSHIQVDYGYNPYHQIGVDYAQVIAGFNLRAELAANLTSDFDGNDRAVYNPALAWSVGFDRNLWRGLNLNLQCNGALRLAYDGISGALDMANPAPDTEADADRTSTQVTCILSKTFLRDELEARVAVIWEPEARDFLVMPSLVWTKDAAAVELSGGIFGGDEDGQFGQFRGNSFVKAALTYTF